jgi:two-component system C4-dicarboxylate transport response regulator DctD
VKILVVDGEPTILGMTALALERGGYEVVLASNAKAALELCEELKGDLALVLADVGMPGMNGRELAKCVAGFDKPIPIVLMSGYSEADPILKGLANGRLESFRFIAKPFTPKHLLEIVSTVLCESGSN